MSIADKILLRKRALIETVNDELKNIAQIEHSRHRSFNNFIANSLSAIAAYCFFEKKPAIDVNFINDGQLTIFWFYIELTLFTLRNNEIKMLTEEQEKALLEEIETLRQDRADAYQQVTSLEQSLYWL